MTNILKALASLANILPGWLWALARGFWHWQQNKPTAD
jgi:hypothetical protein